jgi:hypothetical protein
VSASVTWSGLEELKAALRSLPADLADDASDIVEGAAQAAKTEIYNAYPERTGNLRQHTTVAIRASGRYGAGAVVKNTARHAWMFENGTQARHTAIGANRGSMPAGHVFIPIVMRWRRRMYEQLKSLLVRHGLQVAGDA